MKPASILIVDDDASLRAMLGLALRRAGWRVRTASGGPEALRLLRRGPCRWILTDAGMWPMDGFELALRARRLRPRLRIAMMSATDHERRSRGYPVERFFLKPLDAALLVRWLGGAPGPGSRPQRRAAG